MPDGEAGYPPRFQAWATVAILMLLYLTSLLDRNIITLLGENIRKDLGLTDVQLSYIYGPAFALSYAAGALPLGWAIDRYSRRWVVWAGVTAWSLGTMACGLSRNFTQLFVSRIFVGGGEAVLVPGNQSILADMFPPDRLGFPISIYALGSKFGQGFSLIVGGMMAALIAPAALYGVPLLGDMRGWQLILVAVGLPGIVIAMFIFLIAEPARRRVAGGGTAGGYVYLLGYMKSHARFFVANLAGATIFSLLISAIMAWTPAYFIRVHGLSTELVGVWLGIAIIAGPVIGMPLHGLVADRLFRGGRGDAHMRYVSIACAIAIIPFVAAYTFGNPWADFVLISLAFTAFGAYPALGPAALQLMVPGEMRGKAASLLLVFTSVVGLSAGPTITAWVSSGLFSDPMSIGLALALTAGVGLAITSFCFWLCCKPLALAFSHARPATA